MSSATTSDFTLRYQRVPGSQYHARPLSLLQQDILYRCDGFVTIADLADATLLTHPEIRAALSFLARHGLVKTLLPEAWLFQPPSAPTWQRETGALPAFRPQARIWHWLDRVKTLRVAPRR